VLLSGSWAKGEAHSDSDLDIVIIDETIERVVFEATQYEDWIIDVCVLNPSHAKTFFENSAKYRSAPIPHQIADSVLVTGDTSLAERIRGLAIEALVQGPEPIPDGIRTEIQYSLTLLRDDIIHASEEALPALAAYAHVQLSKTMLDLGRHWRAERKGLRRTLLDKNRRFAKHLDDALVEAVQGNPNKMIRLCNEVLSTLGGPVKTYDRFSA
jgi:hypothetical protein